MSTIATVTTKTYKAALQADGTCIVSGLQARQITGGCDSTRALDRQRALRDEIQSKLYVLVPGTQDDPMAGDVSRWEAKL